MLLLLRRRGHGPRLVLIDFDLLKAGLPVGPEAVLSVDHHAVDAHQGWKVRCPFLQEPQIVFGLPHIFGRVCRQFIDWERQLFPLAGVDKAAVLLGLFLFPQAFQAHGDKV